MNVVNASGPRNAKLAVVGMAPADEEVARGIPFVGPSGSILNYSLQRLGYPREKVYVTNVSNEPLPTNNTALFALPPADLKRHTERLANELASIRPNCVFVLGDEPLKIICGVDGVVKWRGSILPSTLVPGLKCVVSVHPAWIQRGGMWKWEAVFRHIDLKRAIEQAAFPDIRLPKRDYIIRPTLGQVLDYLELCSQQEWVSLDYETFEDLRVACVGVGFSTHEAMCIPFLDNNMQHYWNENDEVLVWKALSTFFSSPVKKIGQNVSFEWVVSWLHHLAPRNLGIDTMLLHHCLYQDFGGTEDFFEKKRSEMKPGHSLRFINSQYTDTPFYKDDRKMWSKNRVLIEHLWRYNCYDVMVTYEAAMKMMDEAKARNLWEFYQRFYNRPFPHTVRMEWEGVLIDQDRRTALLRETEAEYEKLDFELGRLVGHRLNIWSTTQMKSFLYKELGYQERYHRKRGHVTADKNAIEYLAVKHNDPRLRLILEMRKLADFKADVLSAKLGSDGRIHTHFKLGGTDGARWSSTKSILGSGTNLQNVPRKGHARSLFKADVE